MPQNTVSKADNRGWLWLLVSVICAGVVISRVDVVYEAGWITALLVGILAISWVPMNVLALLFERRTLLNPREQFWQFYFGDLLFLPGAMACLAALQGDLKSKPWQPVLWILLCLVVSIGAGLTFHFVQDKPKPGGYTHEQWISPTKAWHDIYVIPVFLFYLALKLPLLWSSVSWGSPTGWLSTLTLVFVALWAALMVVDGSRKPGPLATAHVDYDWAHLRPVKV